MVSRVQKVEKKCLDLLFKKLWKSDVWLLPGPPPSFQHLFTKSHSLIAFQCPFMRDDLSSEISFTSSRHLILCQSHISSQESFGVKISLIKLNFQTWIMVITLVFFSLKVLYIFFHYKACMYVSMWQQVHQWMGRWASDIFWASLCTDMLFNSKDGLYGSS